MSGTAGIHTRVDSGAAVTGGQQIEAATIGVGVAGNTRYAAIKLLGERAGRRCISNSQHLTGAAAHTLVGKRLPGLGHAGPGSACQIVGCAGQG